MTTMHEEWTDRLSEYLDDELPAADRRSVDEHLAGCASCRAVLEDLRRVVARAQHLERRPPSAELWDGVSRRIRADVRGGNRTSGATPRRLSFTIPQALAASLVVALLSGAVVWRALDRSAKASRSVATAERVSDATPERKTDATPERQTDAATEREASAERSDVATVSYADAQYDAAVADLEKALKEGRGRLDGNTVAIVQHNLQIIDQAIEQARQALESDPANSYLSSHLVDARRRKLDLLRRAAALTEGD